MKGDIDDVYSDEAIDGFITTFEEKSFPDGSRQSNLKMIEKKFNLKEGTIKKIVKEDDWSFIIKSHAIIESSLNFSISHRIGCSALENTISFLDTSNSKTGKVEFAKNMLLLENIDVTYIRKLSEIRNKLVHNISNLGFSLASDYQSMDKNQKSSFINKALCLVKDKSKNIEGMDLKYDLNKNPELIKMLMFMHVLRIVAWLHVQGQFDKTLSKNSLDNKLDIINGVK